MSTIRGAMAAALLLSAMSPVCRASVPAKLCPARVERPERPQDPVEKPGFARAERPEQPQDPVEKPGFIG